MENFFDQFDAPPQPPAQAQSGGNFFDQFDDHPPAAPTEAFPGDVSSRESRAAIGMARPMIGAGQVWAHKGADIAEYLGGGEGVVSRGGRKIAKVLDEQANKFADWAKQGRVAAGLGEEPELLNPSTWDVPGTIGETLSPVNLAAGGLAGKLAGGAAAGILGRAAQGAGYGAAYGVTQPVTSADLAAKTDAEGNVTPAKTFDEAKLRQIGTSTVGGAIAGPVGGLVGDIVGPRLSNAVRYLTDRGVRLSTGQTLGGAANRVEQGLESVPGSGVMVTTARHTAGHDFVKAAHNDTLGEIGKALPAEVEDGYAAMRFTRGEIGKEYDAIHATMPTSMTPGIVTGLNKVVQKATDELNREEIQRLQNIIRSNVLEKFADRNGTLNGEEMQAALSKVKTLVREYRDSDKNKALGRYLQQALDVFNMERRAQNPAAAAALAKTDKAYAKSKILEIAHAKDETQAHDGWFTPAQLGKAQGQATSRYQKAGGQALFQDLVSAGRKVIPNTLPNSGTAERRLIHELVLGLGSSHLAGGLPYMAGGIMGTAALYNQPAQTIMRNAIAGGQGVRTPVGDLIRQYGYRAATPLIVDALKRRGQPQEGAQ